MKNILYAASYHVVIMHRINFFLNITKILIIQQPSLCLSQTSQKSDRVYHDILSINFDFTNLFLLFLFKVFLGDFFLFWQKLEFINHIFKFSVYVKEISLRLFDAPFRVEAQFL